MALLTKKFDILRGWPREGAIDESFKIHETTPGTPDTLAQGMLVTQDLTDGTAKLATDNDVLKQVWVVIEGNDDFSAQFVDKVVCLKGNCELRLDPGNFLTGSYGPGVDLSYDDAGTGKWTVATSGMQVVGYCVSDDRSVDGTLVVYMYNEQRTTK